MVCSRVIYRTSQVASHVSSRNNADCIWASTLQNCGTTNHYSFKFELECKYGL